MSAITQRGKRKTAGKRMTALVGKAQEEDDAFWGDDTWADDDSGNESFRDSDEDSALKKDEFDSDFNDSESDREEEERAAGEEEERTLKRQERSKSKGRGYTDVATKRGKGRGKRIMGDGMNAGIVLNFPPQGGSASLPTPVAVPLQPPAVAIVPKATPKKAVRRITAASTRERRSKTVKKQLRESTTKASAAPPPAARKTPTKTGRKSGKRMYKQEELLLEAVHKTEPDNERWLLARKRIKDVEDQDREAAALRDKHKGPLIQKYHSRRGCLKTLTFAQMDAVPEILTRGNVTLKKPRKTFCVITGKRARYKDPKTNLGYFDLASFKELRRRMAANEPLDQRKKAQPKKRTPTNSTQPKEGVTTPSSSGETPTGTAPTTPRTDVHHAKIVPSANASNGSALTQSSPRRTSPRSWKPSEKMRENRISNLGKNNTTRTKSNLVMPGSRIGNSNGAGSIPDGAGSSGDIKLPLGAAKPAVPANGNIPAATSTKRSNTNKNATSATPGGKVKDEPPHSKKTKVSSPSAVAIKLGGTTEPAKVTSAATTTGRSGGGTAPPEQPATSHAENVYTIPSRNTQSSEKGFVTQNQLIMQVIQDYNKQHPGVKE